MSESLITKYRPRKFKDILGQRAVLQSLMEVLKARSAHAFLLVGPSGTGKTTIARIIAKKLDCPERNITEINGSDHTGVDDMRAILEGLNYTVIGDNPNRGIILDECHFLSKSAFASLLKMVEEPPKNTYWFFCTTEPLKVPEAIKGRCVAYQLGLVDSNEIFGLLKRIAAAEKYPLNEDVLFFLAENCEGSPRKALGNLAQCAACKTRADAAALLKVMGEEAEVNELCQELLQGTSWEKAAGIVKRLDYNAESIRHAVFSYMTKVLLDCSANKAPDVLNILMAFSDPYPNVSGPGPVLLSLGRVLFPGG